LLGRTRDFIPCVVNDDTGSWVGLLIEQLHLTKTNKNSTISRKRTAPHFHIAKLLQSDKKIKYRNWGQKKDGKVPKYNRRQKKQKNTGHSEEKVRGKRAKPKLAQNK
jgi:hypothetical protein